MSWDVFAQDFPASATSVADIPRDFKPKPIGARSALVACIQEVVPTADFSDPAWGILDSEDWSIEFNLGSQEECVSLAFHVHGDSEVVVGVVATILHHLGLRAVDSQTGEFFSPGNHALKSFGDWKAFRDRVLGGEQ